MKKIILILTIILSLCITTTAFAADFFGVRIGDKPTKEMGKPEDSRNGVEKYLIDAKDRMFCDTIVSSPFFFFKDNKFIKGYFYFQHPNRYAGVIKCLDSKYKKTGNNKWTSDDATISLTWNSEAFGKGIGAGDVTFTKKEEKK